MTEKKSTWQGFPGLLTEAEIREIWPNVGPEGYHPPSYAMLQEKLQLVAGKQVGKVATFIIDLLEERAKTNQFVPSVTEEVKRELDILRQVFGIYGYFAEWAERP